MSSGESLPGSTPSAPGADVTIDGGTGATAPESFLIPIARDVAPGAVVTWLRLGWNDLMRSYLTGVWFGVCFVAMGALLMLTFNRAPAYLMALISGFLLLGPFICVGCYAISYALERGKQPEIKRAALAFRNNAKNIAIFAAVLGVLELLWGRASLVVFALFYTGGLPETGDVLRAFMTLQNIPFVIAYVIVGAVFATLVFVTSVVAIPLMLNRNTDAITAALTSEQTTGTWYALDFGNFALWFASGDSIAGTVTFAGYATPEMIAGRTSVGTGGFFEALLSGSFFVGTGD